VFDAISAGFTPVSDTVLGSCDSVFEVFDVFDLDNNTDCDLIMTSHDSVNATEQMRNGISSMKIDDDITEQMREICVNED